MKNNEITHEQLVEAFKRLPAPEDDQQTPKFKPVFVDYVKPAISSPKDFDVVTVVDSLKALYKEGGKLK